MTQKIITQAEALAAGLKRYFTGRPCLRGHNAERYTAGAKCCACQVERNVGRPRRPKRPSPRAEALAAGLKRYFTGKPCKRGHLSERTVCDNQCLECHKISHRTEAAREKSRARIEAYRQRNLDKYNKKAKRYYERHREKCREAMVAYHWRNREKRNAASRAYYRRLIAAYRQLQHFAATGELL